MKASKFSDAQKALIIKQGEEGTPVAKGCSFYSDRGKYCSHDDKKIPRQDAFRTAMSGKGNCYGNAASSDGGVRIHLQLPHSAARHSAWGWKVPIAFEQKVA